MNDCLLLPMFPWTPIVQTRAANWLTRFKWKEILSTLGRECIMKNFRAVLEKSNIEVSLPMHILGYILPWTTIFCFGYFIMFKQLFVLHFHKDTFNFAPPMFYVGIWRSHHFMRGATVFWGGHRWPGGPPVASDEKRHPYIYIYIYINIHLNQHWLRLPESLSTTVLWCPMQSMHEMLKIELQCFTLKIFITQLRA